MLNLDELQKKTLIHKQEMEENRCIYLYLLWKS